MPLQLRIKLYNYPLGKTPQLDAVLDKRTITVEVEVDYIYFTCLGHMAKFHKCNNVLDSLYSK